MIKYRELRIQSQAENLLEVEHFIEEISDRFHLNDSYFANIQLALSEAVKNAIVHGNASDKNKAVRILFTPTEKGLLFKVMDEGNGFHFEDSQDPQKMLEEEMQGGRGLLFIHMLSDEVSFSDEGRVIEILFKVSGIDQDTMERRVDAMQNFYKGIPTEKTEKQKQ